MSAMDDSDRESASDSGSPSAMDEVPSEGGVTNAHFRQFGLLALASGFGSLLFLFHLVFFPLGGDQANYSYAAQQWLLGATPYVDVLVFKPPVTLWIFGMAQVFFGDHPVSIRAVDIVLQGTTAFLLGAIILVLTRRQWAAIGTALIYLLLYSFLSHWHASQTDGWFNLAWGASLLFSVLASESRRPIWHFVAGIALGIAFWLKYTGVVFLAPLVIWILLHETRRLQKKSFAALAGGFVLFSLIVGVWLMGVGALSLFVDHHLQTLTSYVQDTEVHGPAGNTAARFLRRFTEVQFMFVGAMTLLAAAVLCVCFGIERFRGRRGSAAVSYHDRARVRACVGVAGLWIVVAVLSLIAQGKFFLYHYLPLLGGVALLCGCAWACVERHASRGVVALSVVFLVGLLALSSAARVNRDAGLHALAAWVDGDREQFLVSRQLHSIDAYSMARAAAWLTENVEQNETVFVWHLHPGVAFLSRFPNPTKFKHNIDFRFPWAPDSLGDELVRELRDKPPTWVLVGLQDRVLWLSNLDSQALLAEWPQVQALIEERCTYYTTVASYRVLHCAD